MGILANRAGRTCRYSSAPKKFGYGLRARPDLQLLVNATDVGVHRFVADAEFLGDFLVEKSLAEEIEHLFLARRKLFGGFSRRRWLLKRQDDFAGDVGRHGRTAAMHFAYGFQ